MAVLPAVLLADGVAIAYNKIGNMPLPDVFVCTAVATNHIRGAFQYMQGKEAVGYSPLARTTASTSVQRLYNFVVPLYSSFITLFLYHPFIIFFHLK